MSPSFVSVSRLRVVEVARARRAVVATRRRCTCPRRRSWLCSVDLVARQLRLRAARRALRSRVEELALRLPVVVARPWSARLRSRDQSTPATSTSGCSKSTCSPSPVVGIDERPARSCRGRGWTRRRASCRRTVKNSGVDRSRKSVVMIGLNGAFVVVAVEQAACSRRRWRPRCARGRRGRSTSR